MAKKGELGRGLNEILSDNWSEAPTGKEIINLPVKDVFPGENQMRADFDEESLKGLADSISEQGVIEPILVHPKGTGYEIIAGERRWRATKIAGKNEIPAIILEVSDPKVLTLIGLIENMQRENLNAVEEAIAFNTLKSKFDMTQEEIAKAVGKSRPVVANTLRILSLPQKIREMVANGQLSAGHTRILLSIDDPVRQMRLALLAIRRNLSVERLAIIANSDPASKKGKRKGTEIDPRILEIQDELQASLGTKVEISKGKKKGKIVIEYYNDDELDSIVKKLGN